ncbi:MAG TPA: ADP-ribosylglycohydrolase family protein [Prolixibacteraceae bacterium]|nr:ADP-ribosylglycohydrolase family protein [Prolixibacteraceae bacterium]HRV89510.1 ADP-ribosylglycohydrolase family protein [Prolixibacteraceae bacterium]
MPILIYPSGSPDHQGGLDRVPRKSRSGAVIITWLMSCFILLLSCSSGPAPEVKNIPLSLLRDKIAGGWAGKMIGVTYGAPTEFRAQGTTYEDSILWKPDDIRGALWQDDIYVQLTFLMTMDRYGMEAPAKRYQELLAKAGYPLWHANVQSRKNYFDSIFPPESGHPDNNLHADDIDFQIEADYIGFICPGMPETANRLAGITGQVMNYGDGLYGGAFVAALYAEAFFSGDIPAIIDKALLSIPAESDYAKIVRDVVLLHRHFPEDWRAAWQELQNKWGSVQICEAGTSFNIDAKLNGAYIVMGLLYGEGDPLKTMEISTRCGQDSDCNPSNAMAVLGLIRGFSGLPAPWQEAINALGDSLFIHTDYSFRKAVDKSMDYATQLAVTHGGKISGEYLAIPAEEPKPLPYADSFPRLLFDKRIPVSAREYWSSGGSWESSGLANAHAAESPKGNALFSGHAGDKLTFTFDGTGVSLVGHWLKDGGKADIFVDGEFKRTIDCYFNYAGQQHLNMDLYHITGLEKGEHTLQLVVRGEKRPESEGTRVYVTEAVVFLTGDKRSENTRFSFQ